MKNTAVEIKSDPGTFTDYVKERSDKLMNYFLIAFFLSGLIFATFYDTWLIALGVGGLCLTAYYLCKIGLPGSNLYQYVLSIVIGVFMAQYIYQMHGMFEMHFFAFIGSAILITYQNWKLQLPILLIVVIHHATFSYLQNIGIDSVYFSQLDYFDLQTFIIHILLAAAIFFICGLWAYELKKYRQKEEALTLESRRNADILEKAYIKTDNARLEAEQANQKADDANKQLEIKNKELEHFAYIASHDLREPLRTTSGFVKLLQQQYEGKLDEKGDKYLSHITQAAGRMKVLIDDLLDYSMVDGKTLIGQVDCNAVLQEVLDDLGIAVSEAGAEVSAGQLPVITAHHTAIKLLFQNLIINGIKFRKKDVAPKIKIATEIKDDSWMFSFADNGIGIEQQDKDKVFVIFQRLHSKQEYEGSGIGLAHCKKIVEDHRGKIWVESELGNGATFYFTISKK